MFRGRLVPVAPFPRPDFFRRFFVTALVGATAFVDFFRVCFFAGAAFLPALTFDFVDFFLSFFLLAMGAV